MTPPQLYDLLTKIPVHLSHIGGRYLLDTDLKTSRLYQKFQLRHFQFALT